MADQRYNVGEEAVIREKQLGQARPANTTAVSIYTPGTYVVSAEVHGIVVCNTTSGAVTYRLFHDADGTTYDATSALAYDVDLPANSTHWISECKIFFSNTSGNLAVRTSSGNAINFTVYGVEVKSQ